LTGDIQDIRIAKAKNAAARAARTFIRPAAALKKLNAHDFGGMTSP
jgi:hypothetical protein